MARHRFATAVLCMALVFTGGCTSSSQAPADVRRVSLGVSREGLSALGYVARQEGFFESNRLEVDFREYSSSQLALEALLAGEVDAALCADTPIVLAALAGRPLRIVSTIGSDANDIRIVARSDAGVAAPRDLRGKRVGTREGTAAHFFLHTFLIRHGMSPRDVEVRFASFEDVRDALVAGQLDAVSVRQPFIAELEAALGSNSEVFEEAGLYEKTMNLCVAADGEAPDDEVVQRLIAALLDAEVFAVSEATTTEARGDVAAAIGIEPDQLCECAFRPESVGLRQFLVLALEEQARWAIESGQTTATGGVPDFLKLIDTGPLDAVRPDRVTVIR